jgi:aminopeptidase N
MAAMQQAPGARMGSSSTVASPGVPPFRGKRLADYRAPLFLVERIELLFLLREEATTVQSRLFLHRAPGVAETAECVLDGRDLECLEVLVNGQQPAPGTLRMEKNQLVLTQLADSVVVDIRTRMDPRRNSALEGLYQSRALFCTQCEAEGFRRITYYPDRPDVMAVFTTTIVASPDLASVMLSNGNCVAQGAWHGEGARDGDLFATWHDPFPKPAYLFALVAGHLATVRDHFITRSGRRVELEIYVEPGRETRCDHAMRALQKAMRWDEEQFGLEYDLDRYMIVAVDDFNAGAMENKGLNVFNSQCVLVDPDTATDDDYAAVEAVIAHEYFHNWTGNRVTCRDWFQLSLKEGLTVFRDQLFSSQVVEPGVARIRQVLALRNRQFVEDAGPMAHPVQPQTYIEIGNFYTPTIYEKGAEVVRMLYNLLGAGTFREGMDRYFQRHDGQAVTVEEFVQAMESASGRDLQQFRLWYCQAGTPVLHVTREVQPEGDGTTGRCTLSLEVRQHCPATPGQPVKEPMHIPVLCALFDREPGQRVSVETASVSTSACVLELRNACERFEFHGVSAGVVPSLLRQFSAPVRLDPHPLADDELAFLWLHDDDPFNRWDAGQELAMRVLLAAGDDPRAVERESLLVDGFAALVRHGAIELALKTLLLTLPSESALLGRDPYGSDAQQGRDPDRNHQRREACHVRLARLLEHDLRAAWEMHTTREPGYYDVRQAARRGWRNLCLGLLTRTGAPEYRALALQQFRTADTMTDRWAALVALVHTAAPEADEALDVFLERYRHDTLVMNKWFRVQSTAPVSGTLARVEQLLSHPLFQMKNPNNVRAVLGGFSVGNPWCFHAASGDGYRLIADHVMALDRSNPHLAAWLMTSMSMWRVLEPQRRVVLQQELQRIQRVSPMSADLFEVVTRINGQE